MEDSVDSRRILLMGGVDDPLNSGYRSALTDEMRTYPSVEHYAAVHTLLRMGLAPFVERCCAALQPNAAIKQIIKENLPPNSANNLDSLYNYVSICRESYVRHGLKLRANQDASFKSSLLSTGESLLIVCDPFDTDFGIGLDENTFKLWREKEGTPATTLLYWVQQPDKCPHLKIGKNKLGLMLMNLRDEFRKERFEFLLRPTVDTVQGMEVSENVVALSGCMRPLSHLYALQMFVKKANYRSVEHFVYEKLMRAIDADGSVIHKIRCTVDPCDVKRVAATACIKTDADMDDLEAVWEKRALKWYFAGTKAKIKQFPILRRLLLTTGRSLIVETHPFCDREMGVGTNEREVQHLLAKKYIGPGTLLTWMLGDKEYPPGARHMGTNKIGIVLMRLRAKLQKKANYNDLLPLIAAPADPNFRHWPSSYMICFTVVSMFHPLYPTPVTIDNVTYPTAEHFLCCEAVRFFNLTTLAVDDVLATVGGNECCALLAEHLECAWPTAEKLYAWDAQHSLDATRKALSLRLEQNPVQLRALLETNDSMLVFCQRYFTSRSEWSVGMREVDLRNWMQLCRLGTTHLAEMCMRPLPYRPAFLGGNRLGSLLMEIRRAFIMKAVIPHNLPQPSEPPDVLLGSDAPQEDLNTNQVFDLHDVYHQLSIWPNPFLLAAKRILDETDAPWNQANFRPPAFAPPPKPLVDGDDGNEVDTSGSVVEDTDERVGKPKPDVNVKREQPPGADLDALDAGTLRAMIMEMVVRMRRMANAADMQQQKIGYLKTEIGRVRDLRSTLNRLLDKKQTPDNGAAAEKSAADEDDNGDAEGEGSSPPTESLPVPTVVPSSSNELPTLTEGGAAENDAGDQARKSQESKSDEAREKEKAAEKHAERRVCSVWGVASIIGEKSAKARSDDAPAASDSEQEDGEIVSD